MDQIIKNYLFILALPIITGIVIRFILRKSKNGYWVTLGLAILTAIAWVAAYVIPNHGSELYGILALKVTSVMAGSFVTGLVVRFKADR